MSLKETYIQIQPKLMTELKIKNQFAAPRVNKVVVNTGIGDIRGSRDLVNKVLSDIGLITGQKPVLTKSKTSIAGFKLRQNENVGIKVTLRGQKMYDFLDRLITYVLPRLRDFQGLSLKGFDGHGNYSLGLREQVVFPEVPFEANVNIQGLQLTIATTAKNNESAQALLAALGFPFAKKSGVSNG